MKRFFIIVLAFLAFASAAQAGTLYFTLKGTNPGGKGTYTGTAALTEVAVSTDGMSKSGIVTWTVTGSAPIKGIALASKETPNKISMSFPNNPVPGVAIGTMQSNGNVTLQWYIGGETAGTEIWTHK